MRHQLYVHVGTLLTLAVHDYTRGMPSSMVSVILVMSDDLIDAICGSGDKELAELAKTVFNNA